MSSTAQRADDLAGRPFGNAIHATAVSIDGSALLILGASGAGKSRLAAALIGASTPRYPIHLVGDDRILLVEQDDAVLARPHPRIAGFLERRGLGIIAYPFVTDVDVRGIVQLATRGTSGLKTLPGAGRQNFSGLPSVTIEASQCTEDQRDAVIRWWRVARTTPPANAKATPSRGAKD